MLHVLLDDNKRREKKREGIIDMVGRNRER